MQRDFVVKGRSVGGSSDLTLLAAIKPGLIDSLESVTYKTRIKRVLDTLHGTRMSAHEYAPVRLLSDAVERVGVIHSVRVAVLEPENKVLLAVSFDGSWESYIRVLWEKVGALLDLIFCGTVDYVTASDHSFEEWLDWAKRVQVETGFFYGSPDSTAKDSLHQRSLEDLRLRSPDLGQCRLDELRKVTPSAEGATEGLTGLRCLPGGAALPPTLNRGRMVRERIRGGLQVLSALYRLVDIHPPTTSEGVVLHRAALVLLQEFIELGELQQLKDTRDRFARQLDWLFSGGERSLQSREFPSKAVDAEPISCDDEKDIQGGIVSAYEDVTHGLVLFLRFNSAEQAESFLDTYKDHLSTEKKPSFRSEDSPIIFRNLSFTLAGLRAAGVDEDSLELFPEEFRQGMAARAGSLGDIRNNHPRRWRLPKRFVGIDQQPGRESIEMETVHAVLQLRCIATGVAALKADELSDSGHPLRPEVEWLVKAYPDLLLAVQPLRRRYRMQENKPVIVEHFGYADGNGQPEVKAGKAQFSANRIHLGEIVLGHDNAADFKVDITSPDVAEQTKARLRWLNNGSFLVMRKYRQFTGELRRAVEVTAAEMEKQLGGKATNYVDVVYGKLMGRFPDGTSIVAERPIPAERKNLFDYGEDAEGRKCPLHAHVRRAHPRALESSMVRPPRLMRRSMSYGPEAKDSNDDADRGLVFMAYNADIGEQFEVVQRWLVGGNSTGSSSGQSCPIVGVPESGAPRYFPFEVEHGGVPYVFTVKLENAAGLFDEAQSPTRLEWGLYLFAPSISVVCRLRGTAAASKAMGLAKPIPWDVARGRKLIASLQSTDVAMGKTEGVQAWKAALEDPESIDRLDSASIWAAIRSDHGGVLRTSYGVLVADRELLKQVFIDANAQYSVCGQLARMKRSFGEISLGMDAGPTYDQQSREVNKAIGQLKGVYATVLKAANDKMDFIVKQAKEQAKKVGDEKFAVGFDMREVLDEVLAVLCEEWFGLSDDKEQRFQRGSADWAWERGQPPLYPGHFTALSRYMFQPNPGEVAIDLGERYGQALREAMLLFVKDHRANGSRPMMRDKVTPAPLAKATFDHPTHGGDNDFVARTMVGILMGFNPTIIGAVLNVVREWQKDGSFGALRAQLAGRKDAKTAGVLLMEPMAAAARMRPMPQIAWRTATKPHRLGAEGAGAIDVKVGDIVVLGLVSGTQQSLSDGQFDERLMFGGVREDSPHPTHACPGYDAGEMAMLGTITALLSRPESMRQGVAPLTFVLDGESGLKIVSVKSRKRALKVAESILVQSQVLVTDQALVKKTGKFDFLNAGFSLNKEIKSPAKSEAKRAILAWGDSWLDYRAEALSGMINKDLGRDLADSLEALNYSIPNKNKFCNWTTYKYSRVMSARIDEFAVFLTNELELRNPLCVVLSAGGNDSIEKTLEKLLNPRGSPDKINPALFAAHLDALRVSYQTILERIVRIFKSTKKSIPVIMHGYDYPIPAGRGALGFVNYARDWMFNPFTEKQYNLNNKQQLQEATDVMRLMINGLNDEVLKKLVPSYPFVRYVDLRGTIEKRWPDAIEGWHDDMHPTDEAFKLMAAKISAEIEK